MPNIESIFIKFLKDDPNQTSLKWSIEGWQEVFRKNALIRTLCDQGVGHSLEPYVIKHPHLHGGFLAWISSQSVIFVCALGSVIPLSYFIGMAVASISAQSSIGMGAVINATFGSIIEIILYAIALTQEKARLVEGS